MFKLIILNFLLYSSIVILSMGIVFMGSRGMVGLRLQKFLTVNSIGEFLVSVVIIVGFLMFFINLFSVFVNYFISTSYLNIESLCVIDPKVEAQDPVRFWPSGTPQTWGVIGTAAALYRATPGNSKVKAATALGSLALTIPFNVYLHAVENPNGFNRLMYSWVHYKNTGVWPANFDNSSAVASAVDDALLKNAAEASNNLNINKPSFLGVDNQEIMSMFSPDNIVNHLLGVFRPVGVEGYLDDLLGQQLLITFLLISAVVGVLILFSVYFLIQTMYNNREYITKRFNNRFVKLYIRYQFILAKISLVILPAFIFLGLLELLVGLYFLLTQPIPF